ncbi:DNA-3-methyladenine glycosylase [Alkalicoccobacillus murimartini]|uniref:Putative 3-methyladenine DNA glycosylase n=1 Tax=Alkalicoccobacillus murimartini TaxID=171685 RepID=A0ABT9YEQ3_9BACI|nr:DNA-3-methyladenine glycosylase [Alkalicoccobacillus murimartini]MDQ0206098.1 DNA-3-methyladenine glycosylase [Alkalicoccobacillus murimartini]
MGKKLNQAFYEQPTLMLAKQLLGTLLVHESDEGTTIGRIVETEAYLGIEDQAAHSFGGRRTKRTEIMFGAPGVVYTYVMHTHCLFNIVSNRENVPEAVLIRAIEPVQGEDLMVKRRGAERQGRVLTNGPGKLTKAMGITMAHYGQTLNEGSLYVIEGDLPSDISVGKRIGIDNSGDARDYPYRFWETGNSYVSK